MNYGRAVARPDFAKIPSLPLPVYIRSTGEYKVDPGWACDGTENQTFAQIFWGISGQGQLTIGGEPLPFGGGDFAFKLSTERHSYFANAGRWELRWATFDGAGADAFMKSYGYPRHIKAAGSCPVHLFEEIETGLCEMTPFRQRELVSTLTGMLALAGGSDDDSSRNGRIAKRFIELAQKNYANGSVNVNALADIIGTHRTTLARAFRRRMNLSPCEYLTRLRMQHALSLLRSSNRTIEEIAKSVGIPDPTYFCRCVRKAAGASPREYRNAGETERAKSRSR